MKRKIFLSVLMVFFCLSVLMAEEQEEQPYKPVFSFSAYGGTMRGEFTLNFETLYNQKWKNWGIQVATMGNVNNAIKEYGVSAGGWWLFENLELGLFCDTLYLEKIVTYGYGGFHGQIRPTARFVDKRFSVDLFYAHPFTKKVLLSRVTADPIFWQNPGAYYYDITTTEIFAKPVKYFGTEIAVAPLKFLKLSVEGIYTVQDSNMYRIRAGAEIKPLNWLTLSIDWTKMHAQQAVGLYMGGNYQAIRAGATISLGRSQEYGFSNLKNYDVPTPRYPVVVIKKQSRTDTIRIADRLKVDLVIDKNSICLEDPLNYEVKISGGTTPYDVIVDFGDGTTSSQLQGQHYYKVVGNYCIKVLVNDSTGHSASDCKCIIVKDCTVWFKLVVEWCKGVGGTPEQGVYQFKKGEKVNYAYGLLKDYANLQVRLDEKPVDAQGTIIMDKDHYIKVCADKECLSVKITSFTASKTVIYEGESIVLTWTTENAEQVTLNGNPVPLNGSMTVKPIKVTTLGDTKITCIYYITYTLKAWNKCSSDSRQIIITVKQ